MINNQTIIYDGSIEGFISAIRYIVMRKTIPQKMISVYHHIPSMFEEIIDITTAHQSDINSFLMYLKNQISDTVIKKILLAYLSEINGFEMITLKYIFRGLKIGKYYLNHTADENVLSIDDICIKVKRECHRFYGLMRFTKSSEGVYYASFEPDHNIISILIPHFTDRLKDQTWIIHDIKRDIAVLYQYPSRQIHQININDDINIEEDERTIGELWRCYFRSLAIESRINPRLQKRCMPRRYWKYLTEKNEITTAKQPSPYLRHRKPA